MAEIKSGYRELQHTADAALNVWAESLEGLFQCALNGMYQLIGVSSNSEQTGVPLEMTLEAADAEGLLVSFLTECLYYLMDEGLHMTPQTLTVSDNRLEGVMKSSSLVSVLKEIKAVTYHKLKIEQSEQRFETTVVFDL